MRAIGDWLKSRLPISYFWQRNFTRYYLPNNLNGWYVFGVLALFLLINQLLTGIWLMMFYQPSAEQAFASIQHIMRDVNYGWLLRYLHVVGASLFFMVMILHIIRGLIYGSYQRPRELVWFIGMVMFLFLLLEAFLGYVLPWGQMSYWGAQVATSVLAVLPGGDSLMLWLRGDYQLSSVTLQRFYTLHVIIMPMIIIILLRLHIIALRHVGSTNPSGMILSEQQRIPFHPYYTSQDLVALVAFLLVFLTIVCFAPTGFGFFLDPANATPANPLQTPLEIKPMWYLAPFYGILRTVPNKILGIIAIIALACSWIALPWIDRSDCKLLKQRGFWVKLSYGTLLSSIIGLGYVGLAPLTPQLQQMGEVIIIIYFAICCFNPLRRGVRAFIK